MSQQRADNRSTRKVKLFPQRDRTVLQQLEDQGFQIPYQCREGYCGACRMTLNSGRVEDVGEPIAFCGANDILACSCKVVVDAEVEFWD